jgi:O-antigen/teichoic acid export membrane protein
MTMPNIGPILIVIGAILTVLALTYLLSISGRAVAPPSSRSEKSSSKRFARNALTPLMSAGVDRIAFWGFWIVALRMLGPQQNGEYAFAANLLTYCAALSDFGLGTVLTRDLAQNKTPLRPLFRTALVIRLRLVLISAPVMASVAIIYWLAGSVSIVTVGATALLAVGLIPTAAAQAYASIYGAWERMDHRALVAAGTALLTVGLSLTLLGAGAGVLGLSIAGVISGTVSFLALARPIGFHLMTVPLKTEAPLKPLLTSGLPLMLNGLLATAFIQIDVLILQALQGTETVGHYTAAFKFINALNALPAAIVLAAFPLMARAADNPEALARWTIRTWRVLISLGAPAVIVLFAYSDSIVTTLLSEQFLPITAQTLAILAWFLPLSFLNGTLQYVMIAKNRQWWLTPAFLITTIFNITTNLAFIPKFGFQAAAVTTIASEIILLTIFAWLLRHERILLRLVEPAARPTLAATGLAVAAWLLGDLPWILAALIGVAVYTVILFASGGIRYSLTGTRTTP